MISSKEYSISKMEREGFGGKILFLSNANKKYVLKAENQGQSVNEFVAQHFLKALRFEAIPTEICVYDGRCYGVTEFQEGISRVSPLQLADEAEEIRLTVLELFILNAVLGNADAGEFYLKGNTVISLDYGESMISPLWIAAAIQGRTADVQYKIYAQFECNNALKVISQHYDDISERVFRRLQDRMKQFCIFDMDNCFDSLDSAFFDGFSEIYEQYLKKVRNEMASLHLVTI